jgi:hypothetical protein
MSPWSSWSPWARRSVRAFPYLLSGIAITLFMAWGLPLLLASRGIGPTTVQATVWQRTQRTSAAPDDNRFHADPYIELRRAAFSDWYLAYPSRSTTAGGESEWPTGSLAQLDHTSAKTPGARRHHPPGSVVTAPTAEQSASFARIDTGLAGWPFRAFASEAWYRASASEPLGYEPLPEFRWNVHLGEILGQQALVPLRPVLHGIALDVLFWATVSWFVIALPSAIRRRRREKYGRCGNCGYAMGAHDVKRPERCPECGAAFARDPLGFAHAPEMHFQNAYAWLILVSSLDIMLTWKILDRGGMEVNPLASLVIDAWGMQGAIAFKFALMMWVIVVCEFLARLRRGAGVFLAYAAVIVSASPVAWSLFLLASNEFFPHVLE